jgi:hypothetical protein
MIDVFFEASQLQLELSSRVSSHFTFFLFQFCDSVDYISECWNLGPILRPNIVEDTRFPFFGGDLGVITCKPFPFPDIFDSPYKGQHWLGSTEATTVVFDLHVAVEKGTSNEGGVEFHWIRNLLQYLCSPSDMANALCGVAEVSLTLENRINETNIK